MKPAKKIGHILAGSLVDGLVMRLAPNTPLEEIKTGKFVSVQGQSYTFFSLITDVELEVTHPDILLFPPDEEETLLTHMLAQKLGSHQPKLLRLKLPY